MSFDPDFFRRATGGSTTTDQLVAGLAFATVATAGLIGWDYFKRQRKPRPPKIAPSMSAEELTRIMEKLVVATDMAGHQMLEYSRFEFEQVAQGRTSVEKMADLCLAEFLQRLNDGTSRVLRDLKATEEEVAEALKYFGPRDPDIRALEAKVLSFKPKIAFTAEEAALVTKETRERTVALLKKRVDDFVRAGITRGKRSLSDSVTRSLQTLVHEARHQALTEHFGKSGEISHFIYVAFAMHKFPETWPERKAALTHVAEVLSEIGCPHAADLQREGIEQLEHAEQQKKMQQMMQKAIASGQAPPGMAMPPGMTSAAGAGRMEDSELAGIAISLAHKGMGGGSGVRGALQRGMMMARGGGGAGGGGGRVMMMGPGGHPMKGMPGLGPEDDEDDEDEDGEDDEEDDMFGDDDEDLDDEDDDAVDDEGDGDDEE